MTTVDRLVGARHDAPPTTESQAAFRALAAAALGVRFVLARRYLYLATLQMVAPVHDHFFPAALTHPGVLLTAFFAPIVTELTVLVDPTRAAMKRAALLEVVGTATLLLHQASYFYATWVIAFWAGMYMVWIAWSASTSPRRAASMGPFLAQMLVAFIFLGGAAGKWTASFWSGEAFTDFFYASNVFTGVRALQRLGGDLPNSTVLTWFSRVVVVFETSMAFIIFLPARLASTVALCAAVGFWLASFDLFEVSALLIGIALAGRLLAGQVPGD